MFRTICLLSLLAPPALAEVIARTDAPAPVTAVLQAQADANGESFEGAYGWELDLEGDGTTEWLVQGIYPFTGGNSFYVRTYLFDGADTGFGAHQDIGMDRSLKRVEREGRTLSLVIYEMLANDARCCPSGESVRLLEIGN
jgi:hypothetical protein